MSSKISILNSIRAGLELAKIVSIIYRNRRLLKPTLKSLAPAVYGFAAAFGTFQVALEGKTKQYFFAFWSACFSVILLFVPLYTLVSKEILINYIITWVSFFFLIFHWNCLQGEEVRVQPKKWFAVTNAIVETAACLLWSINGGAMGDFSTGVSFKYVF